MHGKEFEADLRLLKLGGYDIVLGVDWMKEVSPISFDFNKMEVTFEKDGKRRTLIDNLETRVCKILSGRKLHKMFKNCYNPKVWLRFRKEFGKNARKRERKGGRERIKQNREN